MINKAIIVGRLGNDPESKELPNGNVVAEASVATTERWKAKDGEKKERTEWHRVVFWNKLADVVLEYLKKGSLVYIEGSIRTDKWQDKQGNTRYTTKINARDMVMLSRKESKEEAPKKGPKEWNPEDESDLPF